MRPHDKVAADLGLNPLPTRLLLDCLRLAGHITAPGGQVPAVKERPPLARTRPRRCALHGYVAGTADCWPWWAGLDETVRTGASSGSHEAPPDDPLLAALRCDRADGLHPPVRGRGSPQAAVKA